MSGRAVAVQAAMGDRVETSLAPEALEAVLTTLIENASQSGARNVDIRVIRRDDRTWLEVRDDGQGVPAADRDRLFEPFFTTRRADGGTGLGLAIARSLLLSQGSNVILTDDAPGATFWIALPNCGAARV